MDYNITQKLIRSHLISGEMNTGGKIGLKIDQTLTQDATGTMVMLELEAMGLSRVKTEISAQYVDHNLLQSDFKNADDHIFLRSACQKFGVWFSPPGNGVSHPVHMEQFGAPGKTLLGSDSHTCAAGSMGMLAIGSGGLEVALAMAGEPFYIRMPEIWNVNLTGRLSDWVSAKDVILELLRRYDVDGGVGKIIEYSGPGLEHLSAMDRHVIANMGAELGATTSVFPSDQAVKNFLRQQGRENDWQELTADKKAGYDLKTEINLSELEPLIACPGSPGNVVPVSEVAGREIYQSVIGSSANPGLRDFAVPALILKDKRINDGVSLDINPTSRQILENLASEGYLSMLVHAGARIHQSGCNGCIGMGQAPASGRISLRTVPRNFPGRSGTKEDQVYLCSPETAAASAFKGVITDPRDLEMSYPAFKEPAEIKLNVQMIVPPAPEDGKVHLEKGPNIKKLPDLDPLPDSVKGPVLLKLGDNISTDEILPAGNRVLPFRSNLPAISRFAFQAVDEHFYNRAIENKDKLFFIGAGTNYGQGSSREHAAIAPRFLGLRIVLAKSYARIHYQNLLNFGVLPLTFKKESDYERLKQGDLIEFRNLRKQLNDRGTILAEDKTTDFSFELMADLDERDRNMVLKGGLINLVREKNLN